MSALKKFNIPDGGASLRIFDTVSPDYIVHAVRDRSCEPLLRSGEVAVITDQEGLYPEEGGWYLIEHTNGKTYSGKERRVREIVTTYIGMGDRWWTKRPAPPGRGIFMCSDGPYTDINHLAEKILGQVVGIYRPSEPK